MPHVSNRRHASRADILPIFATHRPVAEPLPDLYEWLFSSLSDGVDCCVATSSANRFPSVKTWYLLLYCIIQTY